MVETNSWYSLNRLITVKGISHFYNTYHVLYLLIPSYMMNFCIVYQLCSPCSLNRMFAVVSPYHLFSLFKMTRTRNGALCSVLSLFSSFSAWQPQLAMELMGVLDGVLLIVVCRRLRSSKNHLTGQSKSLHCIMLPLRTGLAYLYSLARSWAFISQCLFFIHFLRKRYSF